MSGEVERGSTSIVLTGLKETGKTTFLVALWHTVAVNDVAGALVLENFYEGDREYITSRHNEWLAYEPVKRTNVDHDTPIKMTLREARRDRVLHLSIPDLSGETFKAQFEERRGAESFVAALRSAVGVAIFINPKAVDDPTRIRDVWDADPDEEKEDESKADSEAAPAATASADATSEEGDPSTKDDGEAQAGSATEASTEGGQDAEKADPDGDFDAALCCTQVKYVDLLQQFIECEPKVPVRCAVIVSAMDTLDGTPFEDRPEVFVQRRMSLLDQFLLTRRDCFDSRIYGVSAQGREYDSAGIEALAKLGAQRIRVCTGGTRDSDITRPLRWLAFGEE